MPFRLNHNMKHSKGPINKGHCNDRITIEKLRGKQLKEMYRSPKVAWEPGIRALEEPKHCLLSGKHEVSAKECLSGSFHLVSYIWVQLQISRESKLKRES